MEQNWMQKKKKETWQGGIGTVRTQKKKSKGGALTHSCQTAQDMEKKKVPVRGGLQLVSTWGKQASMGTHQWNASGDVALGTVAVMAAAREKCEWSGHQEKASK